MTAIRNERCLGSRAGDEAVFTRPIIPRLARAIPASGLVSRENPELRSGPLCDDGVVVKRVLIVDDHEPFRAIARELLESAGYVVSGEAADAADALAAVAVEVPDAVLLDVQLPDRDGFFVATELTAEGGPAVVLISSREADDYGRRVQACGARGFIPKSRLSAAAFAALVE
jgi:CheY-like chemotaxis protein